MLIKKDIINLRDAALNQAVRLQDKTTVIVRRYARSTKEKNNCASCVFRERGIDASRCEYTLACFAHNRPDREPLPLLEMIVNVYTFGAQKYAENSWQDLPDGFRRYKAAMIRHLVAFEKGEITDKESGLPHLAHMAWNALAVLYFGTIKQQQHDQSTNKNKKPRR